MRPRSSMRWLALGVAVATGAIASSAAPAQLVDGAPAEAADLVLWNGPITTLDEDEPEVEALAAKDGRVLAIGSKDEIAALVGEGTRVVDLQGRRAVPGFIDGHAHLFGIGDLRQQLDLLDTESWDAILERVGEAVAQAGKGQLIRGRGWHQEAWSDPPEGAVEGLPTHAALSAISPDNPVILRHKSGHATMANAKAMEIAGITRDTPDPPGGEIVRDAAGEPIGVFRETASQLLARAAQDLTSPDLRRLVELAQAELLSKGVTSIQDAGSTLEEAAIVRAMAEAGELDVRVWMMLRDSPENLTQGLSEARVVDAGNGTFTLRAIKHSIDGALGSHGAWLLEPYEDLAESTGLNITPIATIEGSARLAIEHGYQLCVHAIGDRANRETLDLFERYFAGVEDAGALRWRVEHAQHLHPDDIPRFASLGVIASMQGIHCTSDAPWVLQRLGEERAREGAYVWQKLMDSGAVVTNGTDAPVEDADPIASFYATVSRRLADGSVFFASQRMSRLEALRSYTVNAAYAAFEEGQKGRLSPGFLADIAVLSRDILTVPEEEIPGARVDLTVVGGRVVFER